MFQVSYLCLFVELNFVFILFTTFLIFTDVLLCRKTALFIWYPFTSLDLWYPIPVPKNINYNPKSGRSGPVLLFSQSIVLSSGRLLLKQ